MKLPVFEEADVFPTGEHTARLGRWHKARVFARPPAGTDTILPVPGLAHLVPNGVVFECSSPNGSSSFYALRIRQ